MTFSNHCHPTNQSSGSGPTKCPAAGGRAPSFNAGALLLASILLQGCSVSIYLSIFNNTANDIEVCPADNSQYSCQELKTGMQLLVTRPLGLNTATNWRVTIRSDGVARLYQHDRGATASYESLISCRGRYSPECTVSVQLQPDGRIFWVGTVKRLPLSPLPPQPEGFPVEPTP